MHPTEFASKMETGIYNLEFTKLDESIRQMIATRMVEHIPEDQQAKNRTTVTDESTSVAVFDLTVCGWRAVRPASIISINPV